MIKKYKSDKKLNNDYENEKVNDENKRVNSLNFPKRINNYFANINEKDSKYYQRTQPSLKYPMNTNGKNNENNNNDSKNEKNKKLPEKEEERNKRIDQLINDTELRYIQDYQKKFQDIVNKKEYKNFEEKMNVLQKNGINIEEMIKANEDNVDDGNEEEKKEENKKENEEQNEIKEYEGEFDEKNKEENKKNDLKNNSSPLTNNYINSNDNTRYNTNRDTKRKPNVDYFEYENLIRSYMKNKKDNLLKGNNKNKDNSINNSFRKSYESNENNKNSGRVVKADSKTRLVYDDDSNFQLSYKLNKRPKKELIKYMKKKDILRKINEIKKEEERKNEEKKKFKNLAKLQENIDNNKKNINNSKYNNKVKNGFYIGNRKNLNNSRSSSQSTILDQNEYLINLIESKQIIAKANKDNDDNDLGKMSKEDYDNFIKEREDNIKNGNLDLIEPYKKEDEIDNKSDIIKQEDEEIKENIPNIEKEKMNLRNKTNPLNKNKEINKQTKTKNNINKNPKNIINTEETEIKEEIPKKEENIQKEIKKPENNKQKEENIQKEIKKPENKKKEQTKPQNLQIETQTIKTTIEQKEKEKENPQTIQVPSTQQSNIPSINQDINTLLSKDKNNDEISENEMNKTSDYQFDEDELEAYNEIFEGIGKFLKLINGRNVLNDLIAYDENINRYSFGFQQLIIICKSNPFNKIRFYQHFIIYSAAFRQICLPFISKAFDKLRLYSYNQQRFSIFDQLVGQVYRIIFFRKLINYINAKEKYEMLKYEEDEEEEKDNNKDKDKDKIKNNQIEKDNNLIKKNIIPNDKKKEMEIKLNNAINTFENPIRAYVLQKIFDNAYKVPFDEDSEDNNIKKIKNQNNNNNENVNNKQPDILNDKKLGKEINKIPNQQNKNDDDELKGINNKNDNLDDKNEENNLEKKNKNENINDIENKYNDNLDDYLNKKNEDDKLKNFSDDFIDNKMKKDNKKELNKNIEKLNDINEDDNKKKDKKEKPNKKNLNDELNNIRKDNKKLNDKLEKLSDEEKEIENNIINDKKENEKKEEENDISTPTKNKIEKVNNEKNSNSNSNILINFDNSPKGEDENKKFQKLESGSSIKSNNNELDISAHSEVNDIDWQYTIPQNKNYSDENDNVNYDDNKINDLNKDDNKKNNQDDKNDNSYDYNDFEEDTDNLKDDKNDNENIINVIKNEENENNYLENKSRNVNEDEIIPEDIPEDIQEDNKKDNINIIDNHSSDKKDNEKNPIDLSNSFKYKDSSYNSLRNNRYNQDYKQSNNKDDKNEEIDEIKVEDDKMEKINLPNMNNQEKNKLIDDLTNQIINNLLNTEIKNKNTLLPKKLNINISNSGSINNSNARSLGNSQNFDYNNSTNSSIYSYQSDMSNLNNSIFMRPIKEIQKDKTLNLYNEKIAPKVIKSISKEIDSNYPDIINNLKEPFEINETELMNGIMLKNDELFLEPKNLYINKNISKNDYLNKEKILQDLKPIDKKIRKDNNNLDLIEYDNILNECMIDAANELIEKERMYGTIGKPLKWSIRNRNIDFKYSNDDNSKRKFRHNICKELNKLINFKMALISNNYENIDLDLISADRDKKFYKSISNELKDNDDEWKNFETEETKVKLILSKIIMDQLLNEIVEILEHVNYSRKNPAKYQNKSIYACEDIPRLSFQNTTENNPVDDKSDNDINI